MLHVQLGLIMTLNKQKKKNSERKPRLDRSCQWAWYASWNIHFLNPFRFISSIHLVQEPTERVCKEEAKLGRWLGEPSHLSRPIRIVTGRRQAVWRCTRLRVVGRRQSIFQPAFWLKWQNSLGRTCHVRKSIFFLFFHGQQAALLSHCIWSCCDKNSPGWRHCKAASKQLLVRPRASCSHPDRLSHSVSAIKAVLMFGQGSGLWERGVVVTQGKHVWQAFCCHPNSLTHTLITDMKVDGASGGWVYVLIHKVCRRGSSKFLGGK